MTLTASTFFFAITQLLGGLGLFVFGMSMMSGELQKSAGNRLRSLLHKLTKHKFSGLGTGSLLGFLIHSGPVTIMLVGFINAGLMTLEQSVPVMLGANVGTTLSMQIISFNITKIAYIAIFIGIVIHLAVRRDAIRHLGLVLFGFGLLFLGMDVMSGAVRPMKDSGYFEALLKYTNASSFAGMMTGWLFATIFTAIIQSSGATIGILFALSTAGVFTSLDQVFPLILGAHVGTCGATLIGSIGTQITAKRSAISHLLFNVIGSFMAMAAYPLYSRVIPMIGGDVLRQIANTHTAVQLINALIFLPFSLKFSQLVVRLTPSTSKEQEKTHLDESLLETPEKAIVAALMELKRMSRVAKEMFQTTMRGFLELDPEQFIYVRKCEEILDTIKDTVGSYLVALAERNLSRRQAIIIQYLMSTTNDLERIGDHVETLAELTREKIRKNIWFEEESVLDLIELYKKADVILGIIVDSFEPSFYDAPSTLATKILEIRNEYVALSQTIKQKENAKILAKTENPLNGIFYHRLVVCFDKLVKHSKTIALVEKEPFFFVKKHKLDKKSDKRRPNDKIKNPSIHYDSSLFEE